MALTTLASGILATEPASAANGDVIGTSREGRPVSAFRFGHGRYRISLLAGCHADEPVGPLLLRHLCAYLATFPETDPLLTTYEWWIVPHINPDGDAKNRAWSNDAGDAYDIATYLRHVVREQPGDDIEFGFPENPADRHARPEPHAAYAWWRTAGGPFHLHVSLHGMAFAAGPWHLIDAAWADRSEPLRETCEAATDALGYSLHDVERLGEKGFVRIARGFTTRPDSRAMKAHFLERGDEATAGRFRPSSMETIRSLGGDALTLVSEMPLFLTPGVGEVIGPPDPAAERWRARIDGWRTDIANGASDADIRARAASAGLRSMSIRDQMTLQWVFVAAGVGLATRVT